MCDVSEKRKKEKGSIGEDDDTVCIYGMPLCELERVVDATRKDQNQGRIREKSSSG